jgi:predicted RNase H-like HicB family nuclease
MSRLEFEVEYAVDETTGEFVATLPGLGYISSFGATFEEAEANIMEAAMAYLEALQKEGIPLPQAGRITGTVLVLELAA